MDKKQAMFIINKKPKEIRDVLALCDDIESGGDKKLQKNFYILLGLVYGEKQGIGVGRRLSEVYMDLTNQSSFLYSLKYTIVRRDGDPVDVSIKEVTHQGVSCTELYIIYRYEESLYHLPATEEDVQAAGLQIPGTYTEKPGSITPALSDPIPDNELEEAIYVIMKELGRDSLQTPPKNIIQKRFEYPEEQTIILDVPSVGRAAKNNILLRKNSYGR